MIAVALVIFAFPLLVRSFSRGVLKPVILPISNSLPHERCSCYMQNGELYLRTAKLGSRCRNSCRVFQSNGGGMPYTYKSLSLSASASLPLPHDSAEAEDLIWEDMRVAKLEEWRELKRAGLLQKLSSSSSLYEEDVEELDRLSKHQLWRSRTARGENQPVERQRERKPGGGNTAALDGEVAKDQFIGERHHRQQLVTRALEKLRGVQRDPVAVHALLSEVKDRGLYDRQLVQQALLALAVLMMGARHGMQPQGSSAICSGPRRGSSTANPRINLQIAGPFAPKKQQSHLQGR